MELAIAMAIIILPVGFATGWYLRGAAEEGKKDRLALEGRVVGRITDRPPDAA